MAVGDIYELAFDQTVHGIPATNVMRFRETVTDAANPLAGATELNEAFFENIVPTWQALTCPEWSGICLKSRKILPVGGVRSVKILPTTIGSRTIVEAWPANQSATATFYTTPGSGNRFNRSFFTGLALSDEVKGLLTSAARVLITNLLGQLLLTITPTASPYAFIYNVLVDAGATALASVKQEVRSQTRKTRSRTQELCEE